MKCNAAPVSYPRWPASLQPKSISDQPARQAADRRWWAPHPWSPSTHKGATLHSRLYFHPRPRSRSWGLGMVTVWKMAKKTFSAKWSLFSDPITKLMLYQGASTTQRLRHTQLLDSGSVHWWHHIRWWHKDERKDKAEDLQEVADNNLLGLQRHLPYVWLDLLHRSTCHHLIIQHWLQDPTDILWCFMDQSSVIMCTLTLQQQVDLVHQHPCSNQICHYLTLLHHKLLCLKRCHLCTILLQGPVDRYNTYYTVVAVMLSQMLNMIA